MLPFGLSTVALTSTLRTSSSVMPIEASLCGIDLHTDCRGLLAADQHLPDPGNLRQLLRHEIFGVCVDFGDRCLVRLHRQDEDRRIGWIVISRNVGGFGIALGSEPSAALIASSTRVCF